MVDKMPHLLAGRYEIRKLIGRGGMAEVYIGFDTRLSRTVAIKMLRVELSRDAVFQTRFRREAQSAASLNHPTIVAVYDTGEETVIATDGQAVQVPYIVMEYVDGHTVKDLLADGQPVPINEAVEIVVGVLNALEYSHKAGLVHRDIKPGNVMLTEAGKIKVMDFGIARAMTDSQATMTQTDAVVGTAQYLSPEQAKGETVDARSDLYSTGCLLFELLTGVPPFKGDSAVSVAYQHVSKNPPLPSSITPDIPSGLDAVVMKAMAKDPNQRYSSAKQMRDDILAAVSGRAVAAPPAVVGADDSTQAMSAVSPEATAVFTASQPRPDWQNPNVGPISPFPAYPSKEELEPKPSKMKWVWGIIIALIIILGAATVYIMFFQGSSSNQVQTQDQVSVPVNMEGLSKTEVADLLKQAGLVMQVGEPAYSDTVTKDTLISSNPKGGTKVNKGSTVVVVFSAGPKENVVPDVAGLSQDDAISRLKEAGIEFSKIVLQDNGQIAEGKVVGTDIPAGTKLKSGEKVQLLVSSGRVTLPSDLAGKSKDEVLRYLAQNGLNAEIVTLASRQSPPDTVISVSPSGVVNKGTVVKVVVAVDPGVPAESGGSTTDNSDNSNSNSSNTDSNSSNPTNNQN